MLEPVFIGDRVILVEPSKARAIRERQNELAEKSRSISRELRIERLTPRGISNVTQKVTGSNHVSSSPEKNNVIEWRKSKSQALNDSFQSYTVPETDLSRMHKAFDMLA